MSVLTRGDDSDAFGRRFLRIKLTNTTEFPVVRAEWHCGKLIKDLGENPEFPYTLVLTSAETKMLQNKNECFLICWDSEGRKYTCPQKGTFNTVPEK